MSRAIYMPLYALSFFQLLKWRFGRFSIPISTVTPIHLFMVVSDLAFTARQSLVSAELPVYWPMVVPNHPHAGPAMLPRCGRSSQSRRFDPWSRMLFWPRSTSFGGRRSTDGQDVLVRYHPRALGYQLWLVPRCWSHEGTLYSGRFP